MTHIQKLRRLLLEDFGIIAFSIIVTILLVKTDVLGIVLTSTRELEWIGSFISGMFFTSAFTTAPAIVTLGEIAHIISPWTVAFFGALGALVVDIIIFKFARDRFADHLLEIIEQESGIKRTILLLRKKSFRWITFLIGGLIIASPLPDELGISILGFSKMKLSRFIIFSFISNFIGILLIGYIGRALF